MTKKITIESIEIAGFRAYLKSRSFNLRRGSTALSLAVFAPNAKGKSSIVDAFEFYFSPNATLERLGVKAADRNAGRAALEHVNAKTNGISSSVGFKFRDGTDTFGDSRPVVQAGAALTDAAQRVLAQRNVDFVIRGYELRAFVEQQTPERRYDEIVKWFGLQPLLAI